MTPLEFFVLIFVYNLLTFGKGPAMLPVLQTELVDRRGLIDVDQLLYAFTAARITPGQANAYAAAIGFMLFGLLGAALATLALQLPGYLILPVLHQYDRLKRWKIVRDFTRGVTASSVGLIFATIFTLGGRSLAVPVAWVVFLLTFVLHAVFKWNPVVSLLVASGTGLALNHV